MKKIIQDVLRWFRRWTPIYWFRARVWHRYHLVDLRGEDGYRWGYMDPCSKLYLACFKILKEYVDEEGWAEGGGPSTLAAYYDLGPTGRPIQHECKKMGGTTCSCPERDWWDGEREQIEEQIDRQNRTWALYVWWTVERKKEREEIDSLLNGVDLGFDFEPARDGLFEMLPRTRRDDPRWQEWVRRDNEFEEKDEEMLRKLIELRRCLWT